MNVGTPLIALAEGLTADVVRKALEARLAKRVQSPAPRSAPSASNGYALAAAVLHVFDPVKLQPFGPADASERLGLDEISAPAIGWRDRRCRMLLASARSEALGLLGSRERLQAALAANPDRERTGVQSLFETWLADELDPASLGYAALEELRQLYDWGLGRFGGLPEQATFNQLRARRARTAIFEDLVDKSFTGRDAELQRLRDHVGVAPASLWRRVSAFAHPRPPAPLLIEGPGGAGKTALIGAFLMEHVERSDGAWFPFAYLAFDNEVLDVREPWTLLAAASEQIGAQIMPSGSSLTPELIPVFESFRAVLSDFRAERATLLHRASALGSQAARVAGSRGAGTRLYAEFANLLNAAAKAAGQRQVASVVPIVLVLDTFEEVLYRTNEDLYGLWEMLSALQLKSPSLRIVISGRAKPRPFEIAQRAPEELVLGDLAEPDAVTVLERLGVVDAAARQAIVRQVGGSPLSLRLAARAAREEDVGSKGFANLQTHRLILLKLSPELIRGQLYRRILGHIHHPDVARLAHPGMVLRRVTPEIIAVVLAPVCGVQPVDAERARELFEELRREHALVRLADDASLRYREEVRGPMLKLLAADKPDEVRVLHERAAAYYAQPRFTEPLDRAEELYHRMMLEQPSHELQGRWLPGADRFLGSAIPEIPPVQKIWLAQHMSIELSQELLDQADQAEWERVVGYRALELVRHGLPEQTLQRLGERTARTPDSALFAIEIRALTSLGRFGNALALSRQAAAGWTMANQGRLAEVLWLGAQVARQMGASAEALELLRHAEERTCALPDQIPHLQVLTELVALVPADEAADLRAKLAQALDALEDGKIDRERSLVRLACVRLGPGYPRSILRVLPMVLSDFAERILHSEVSIGPVLPQVLSLLRQTTDEQMLALAHRFTVDEWRLSTVLQLLEALASIASTTALPALLTVMSAENADLGAATLGGLEAYREDFETRAAPEAMA